MKLKAITSALASAGLLALGSVSGSVQAGAMAGAVTELTNFQILKSVGGAQIDKSDLVNLSFTSTMDYSASLNGVTLSGTASSSTGPGIDKPAICVGSGCVGAIDFTANNTWPKPTAPMQGNYAATDQLEQGSPITGLTGYVGLADVRNSAYVGLKTGSGTASTSSNNNLQASWTFTAGYTGGMVFDFDLAVFLQVFLDADETAPTFATATWNQDFSLTCVSCAFPGGTVPQTFAPNPLSFLVDPDGPGGNPPFPVAGPHTQSANAPGSSGTEFLYQGSDHFSISAFVIAGQTYQLSARTQALADLERIVPEPSVLALLGLGLLGLGATLRRKSA